MNTSAAACYLAPAAWDVLMSAVAGTLRAHMYYTGKQLHGGHCVPSLPAPNSVTVCSGTVNTAHLLKQCCWLRWQYVATSRRTPWPLDQ